MKIQSNLIVIFILLNCLFNCYSQNNYKQHDNPLNHTYETSGDYIQLILPISAGLTTIIKKDWEGTKQFAFSYATTLAITYSLKTIVDKKRPESNTLYNSFPSGHTASAFSGASFIQRRYGWKYGKWAYLLATFVGVSRIEGGTQWHDPWDILGGAAVGIGSTYIFTKPNQQDKIDIGFITGNDNYVLTFNYKF